MEKLYGAYHGRGFELIGMVESPFGAGAQKIIKEDGLTFPNVDASDAVIQEYGAQAPPVAILIDKKGAVVYSTLGLPGTPIERFWGPKIESALKS